MTIPRYVVGTAAEATRILHRLSRAGWHPRAGFGVPPVGTTPPANLVLYGRAVTYAASDAAVNAASRGLALVVIADPSTPPGRALLAALEGLGPVHRGEHHADVEATVPVVGLPARINGDHQAAASLLPEQRALLSRLANGETIATAAAAEFLSLRTANRRIAQARTQLGVRTTREAVLVFLRQRRGD